MNKSKLNVMVVDDSAVVLERLRYALEQAGYQVTVRESALGTVAAVLKGRPDVLVLDVSMPALAGDRLASLLSEMGHGVIIILHSSLPVPQLRELANGCGAHGIIPKSSDLKSFVRQLEQIVQGSARMRAAGRISSA